MKNNIKIKKKSKDICRNLGDSIKSGGYSAVNLF